MTQKALANSARSGSVRPGPALPGPIRYDQMIILGPSLARSGRAARTPDITAIQLACGAAASQYSCLMPGFITAG